MIFILATSAVIPAFAQNVSLDEQEVQIRQEIKECEQKIRENDTMTDAEKTVAQRNCSTEVRNKHTDENITHKQTAEMKHKLKDMQRCVDWHEQYKFLTEEQFRLQKNYDMATNCITLYNDDVWEYQGEDKLYVMAIRLDEIQENQTEIILVDSPEIPNPIVPILAVDKKAEKIAELESEIALLKEELVKKEQIIQEQIKVLLDLTNQFRNTLSQINSFFGFDSFKL